MNREEFIDALEEQNLVELGKKAEQEYKGNTFVKGKEHIGRFEKWCYNNSQYLPIYYILHDEEKAMEKQVIECIVKDLDYNLYRKQIPEEYYEQKVFLTNEYPDKPARKEIVRILNKRWIFKQLGMILQKTDNRELFYKVRKSLGGKLDNKTGNPVGAAKTYYEYIVPYLYSTGYIKNEYWGYVPDYLEVDIKPTVIIYDINMNETFLSIKNLVEFEDVPFFLIICEKTILIDFTMRELINRGYDKGFYGISLGGFPVTAVIKYLIPFLKVRNFHIFVQHDLDIHGLEIYFNMVTYFPCESVGVNSDFLKDIGVEFEEIAEDYVFKFSGKSKKDFKDKLTDEWELLHDKKFNITKEKLEELMIEARKESQELGARGMVNKLNITKEEKEKYNKWINMCRDRRAEINSLLTKREDEDYTKNKARDFVNYLIKAIEDPERPWNLTRIRQMDKEEKSYDKTIWTIKTKIPRVNVIPELVSEFNEDIIKDKIDEEHKDYLDLLTEIGDIMTTNIESIEEKLENLTNAENDIITNIIEEIENEYPNLFDWISWTEILQDKYPNKVEKLNSLIKMSIKRVRFMNIRKYIELTKQLKSHKGSIKGNAPKNAIVIKEKELQKYTENNPALENVEKRKNEINKPLQTILRRTDKYKEVKADIIKLEEELENREVEEDEREGVLKEFKDKLEKIFEDLFKELKEFEVEEEIDNEYIEYLEDE